MENIADAWIRAIKLGKEEPAEKELRYNIGMEKQMFDRVDELVNQKWVDELVEKAHDVTYDAMVCEPFEVDDVLDYVNTIIRERVAAKIQKEL